MRGIRPNMLQVMYVTITITLKLFNKGKTVA